MQAHGQEEMFMGHNQVGWSSNPGKWWLKRNLACSQVLIIYHKHRYEPVTSLTRKCVLLTQLRKSSFDT